MGFLYETADLAGTGLDRDRLAALEGRAAGAVESLARAGFATDLERRGGHPGRTDCERVAVLGIGGSALGARSVHLACRTGAQLPITVVDNVDPEAFEQAWAAGDPGRTAWVVISKSGGTTEVLAQWNLLRGRLARLGGPAELHVVTGASGPLRELARADGLPVYDVPEEVGGRFSVFTPAATVPLALAGHDVESLREGARAALADALRPGGVAARLAALLCGAAGAGRNVVTFWTYAERLETVGEWFRQLWAESLGKRLPDGGRIGQTPLHCVGSTDQHSIQQLMVEGPRDKVVLVLSGPAPRAPETKGLQPMLEALREVDEAGGADLMRSILDAMRRATTAGMVRAGCPAATLRLDGWTESDIGALLMTFLCATVLGGELLGVNPYGQPGVEAAKIATKELLAGPGGAADEEIGRMLGEGSGQRCP
jgi:glucose-6-phosphate isomerase